MDEFNVEIDGRAVRITADSAGEAAQKALQLSVPSGAQHAATARRAEGFVGGLVKRSALPVAGQFVGGALGGLLASPTVAGVPAGVLAGEAVGGAAGESLNQFLGITEPSAAHIALAAAGGPLGRAIGAGAREGARFVAGKLPGAAGALQETARGLVERIPAMVRPPVTSKELYNVVEQFNPTVTVPTFRQAATELLGREAEVAALAPALESGAIKGVSSSIRKATAGQAEETVSPLVDEFGRAIKAITSRPEGQAPFQAVRAVLHRLGERIGELRQTGGEGLGAMKKLYGALQADLEAAAASDAVPAAARTALRAANAAARKEFAAGELGDYISKSIVRTVDQGGQELVQVTNPGRLVDFIRNNEQLLKSLSQAEFTQIRELAKQAGRAPKLPPPEGANVGSMRAIRQIATGGAAGTLLGGPEAGVAVAGITAMAPAIISRALLTENGRRLIGKVILDKGAGFDRPTLATLAQIVRSEFAQPAKAGAEETPGGTVELGSTLREFLQGGDRGP